MKCNLTASTGPVRFCSCLPIDPHTPIRFAPVGVRDQLRFPDQFMLHAADVRGLRGQIDRSSAGVDPLNGVLHIVHRHRVWIILFAGQAE